MEDVHQILQSLQWGHFAFKDPVVWQFDPDKRFGVARLLEKVKVLLLSSVHELGVFTCLFEDLLDILHVDPLILVGLFPLVELQFHLFFVFGPNLKNLNGSILYLLRHHRFPLLFQLSQLVIIGNR